MPTSFGAEIAENIARNRRPMVFWTCVVLSPLAIAAAGLGIWMNFGQVTTPKSILSVQVPISDRTWSIFQSAECVRVTCEDEMAAKSFLGNSAPEPVQVITPTGSGNFRLSSMSDSQWARFSELVTQDGQISLADVTSTAKGLGTLSTFSSGDFRGQMTFSSEEEPGLASITIGGAR